MHSIEMWWVATVNEIDRPFLEDCVLLRGSWVELGDERSSYSGKIWFVSVERVLKGLKKKQKQKTHQSGCTFM